jgi:hypothetical protein
MKRVILLMFLVSLVCHSIGQEADNEKKLIQFSGVVVDGDNLIQMPFTNIVIENESRGTICDAFGYFSFVAKTSDTIVFSHVGYRSSSFVIPDTLSTNRYSLIQMLSQDTVKLQETVIYPWPSKEDFKKAFLTLQIPEDDYIRAEQNLALAERRARVEITPMSASENYSYKMRQQQSRLYYAGQYPPNNLLNPISWAKFVKAWKNGDLKRQ